ncbi:MAG: hypothetical protein ACTSPY_08970 [Candidatus Helarchaeota archaeon]
MKNSKFHLKKIHYAIFIVLFFIQILILINFLFPFHIPINKYNIDLETTVSNIDYLGAYSFTDDIVGTHPINWTITEDGISNIQVIESYNLHSKVVQIQASNAANPGAGKMILNLSEQLSKHGWLTTTLNHYFLFFGLLMEARYFEWFSTANLTTV